MFIHSYKKSKCSNGCSLFNDGADYAYWENRTETTDEISIIKFVNNYIVNKKINILHIGIGNSYVAKSINNFKKIDGITISGIELSHATSLKIANYNAYFINKLSHDAFLQKKISDDYDLIIDVNLKSFSCCEKAFNKLFNNYISKLNMNGTIITGRKGMNWSRIVRPVYSLSFRKLLYKRLKEFDGPSFNILTIPECERLAKTYNLKLFFNDEICSFKKI